MQAAESRREQLRRSAAKRRREQPDAVRAINARHRELHRDRVNARALIGKRIERGALIRPDRCQRCNTPCKPQAHHPDYSKPELVEFLCPGADGCHRRAEKEKQRPTPARTADGGAFSLSNA